MPQRRSTRGGFGLILLAAQIMQIGSERIPSVTLLTVIVNTVIYMRLLPVLPSVHKACTSNNQVFVMKDWKRIFLSSFYHLDDMHLYYNMVSFIWKGMILERKMKSQKFLIVICLFSVLTQVVMLGLNRLFAAIFLNEQYLYTCAAGFSAVVFALKVLTTSSSSDNEVIMGITVPTRYACWVELIVIQVLVPNASFTGHLAGILVGLMYTKGPLQKIVKLVNSILKGLSFQTRNGPSYNYQSGTTGTSYSNQQRQRPTRNLEEEDEELQRALQESLRETRYRPSRQQRQPPSYGWNVDVDSDAPPYPTSSSSHFPELENRGYAQPRNKLYPNVPKNDYAYRGSSVPPQSPPKQDTGADNYLPYPPSSSDDQWKSTYKSDFVVQRPRLLREQESSPINEGNKDMDQETEEDVISVRKARLRRFDQK